jgi:hypothetical protein
LVSISNTPVPSPVYLSDEIITRMKGKPKGGGSLVDPSSTLRPANWLSADTNRLLRSTDVGLSSKDFPMTIETACKLICDPKKLGQMRDNLLSEYEEIDKPFVHVSKSSFVSRGVDEAGFPIISEDDLPKVLERLSRAAKTTWPGPNMDPVPFREKAGEGEGSLVPGTNDLRKDLSSLLNQAERDAEGGQLKNEFIDQDEESYMSGSMQYKPNEYSLKGPHYEYSCERLGLDPKKPVFPGTKLELLPYQPQAAACAIDVVSKTRARFFVISDDAGLGKTNEALTVIMYHVRSRLNVICNWVNSQPWITDDQRDLVFSYIRNEARDDLVATLDLGREILAVPERTIGILERTEIRKLFPIAQDREAIDLDAPEDHYARKYKHLEIDIFLFLRKCPAFFFFWWLEFFVRTKICCFFPQRVEFFVRTKIRLLIVM